MIVRAKAPLRIGLAGGGTDVSPYSDDFGGCILNATINMFAYTTIEVREDNQVYFEASDLGRDFQAEADSNIALDGDLLLHKAVYNRVIRDFNNNEPIAISVITYSDAPPGSGLGSSSTMVVSMLAAYRELLKLPLGEYDLAHLAFEIEREDCQLSGGKQDQYAATFGGVNFMEFNQENVLVNPLRIRTDILNEIESQMVLYFTGVSRDSAKIIDDQIKASTDKDDSKSLESLHQVKQHAFDMKECLLRNDIDGMSDILKASWIAKKGTSSSISNPHVEEISDLVLKNGAKSLKLSGAGGGGFMMIFAEPTKKHALMSLLEKTDGQVHKFQLTQMGVQAWTV